MLPTVITPAVQTRLTTLVNARLDLGLGADSPSDALLERWIDQASSSAASFCDRVFGRQIYRERILKVCREGMVLQAGPVNRIVAVSIQGGATYDDADYLLEDGKLRLTYESMGGIGDGSAYNLFWSMQPALIVDYEAGWVLPGEEVGTTFQGTTKLPADIELAVTQLIASNRSEAGRDPTIKSESNEGVGSVSYYVQGAASRLAHPGAEATLSHYRSTWLV